LEQFASQFQALKADMESLAWNIKGLEINEQKFFPAKQMLQFATYQDLIAILQCVSCKRWKWTSSNTPALSVRLKVLKRKILHAEQMPLMLTQFQNWPQTTAKISLHHLTHTFCIASEPPEQCEQCGQTCPGNVTCVNAHKKYNCAARNRNMRKYEECDVCLMKYPLNTANIDYRATHRHFDEMCHNCKNIIPADKIYTHSCPLRVFTAPVPYRKMACYDFETAAMQNENGEKIHEPAFLSCYFETSKVCHFSKINFASTDMNFPETDGIVEHEDDLFLNYYDPKVEVWLPKSIDYKMPEYPFPNVDVANTFIEHTIENNPLKGKYNQSYRYVPYDKQDAAWLLQHYGVSYTEDVDNWAKTAAHKFIRYILRPRFKDYVFLAHNAGGFDLNFIYNILNEIGFPMHQVHRKNSLDFISLSIDGPLNILFLDTLKYFSTSLSKQAERSGLSISKTKFPYAALEQKLYNLVDVPYKELSRMNLFANTLENRQDKKDKDMWLRQQIKKITHSLLNKT